MTLLLKQYLQITIIMITVFRNSHELRCCLEKKRHRVYAGRFMITDAYILAYQCCPSGTSLALPQMQLFKILPFLHIYFLI